MNKQTLAFGIFACLILAGGIFGGVFLNNRMASDRLALSQQQEQKEKKDRESKESLARLMRGNCLISADTAYWEYVRLNATSTRETATGPVYTAYQSTWDVAESSRKAAKDECYRQYP